MHLEALDARDAWPPLLKPGVLAGHDVYAHWEERLLEQFLAPVVGAHATLASALAAMICWSDTLRAWRPGDGALEVLVRRRISVPDAERLLRKGTDTQGLRRLLGSLLSRVPTEWRPVAWPAGLTDATRTGPVVSRAQANAALARYLATRLVGSWVTYQGGGLRSVAAALVSAYVLAALALSEAHAADQQVGVTIGRLTSAIRASDWLLLHLLDRQEWAAWCTQYEDAADARPLLELISGATHVLDSLPWQTPA